MKSEGTNGSGVDLHNTKTRHRGHLQTPTEENKDETRTDN